MHEQDNQETTPKADPQPGSSRCVVWVALSAAVLPDDNWFHDVLADLNSATSIRGYWSDGVSASFTVAELTPQGPEEIGFGSIRLVAAPIAEGALKKACYRSWRWQQAAEVLSGHTHHWVVSVTTDTVPFHNAMVIGRLLAALSRCSEFIGAYFSPAEIVHSPEALQAECDVEPDAQPVDLWVHVTLDAHEDFSTTLRTKGLIQFGVPELEIVHSRLRHEELYEEGPNFADSLMKAGPVLQDGDAVRTTENIPHRVTYGPSIYDQEETVCRIQL